MTGLALLAPAPEVARATVALRRRTVPAVLLVVIGLALIAVPIATGMFSKAAAGQQVLDRFEPHLEAAALDQVHHDLSVLEAGRTAAASTVREGGIPAGRFPGVDVWIGAEGDQINARSQDLLASVRNAVPDYQAVHSVSGFDRIPFLVVAAGLAFAFAGLAFLRTDRRDHRPITAVALVAATALVAFPFASGLAQHAGAAQSLLARLRPIVTDTEVVRLQRDFVVVVTAEGEVDTDFASVPGSHAAELALLRGQWPQISADLADLVGTLNDSIADVSALTSLNDLPIRGEGFRTLPWAFVGTGLAAGALALIARPRPTKEYA